MPQVTVLMPVFNGEKFIKEAIDSVLKQSFTDFELLIMDDGSMDNTLSLIKRYSDKRIRLETRTHDFIGNLNEGLRLAQGKYIARMDADDIMHSERLRIQVKIMEQHPEFAVCGTWLKNFGEGIIPKVFRSLSGEIPTPLLLMLKSNILFHPTIMLRKSFLLSKNIRYENYPAAEDYKLYLEIAKAGGYFYIEPQVLLFYRSSDQQVTQKKRQEMLCTTLNVRHEIIVYLLNKYAPQNDTLYQLYTDLKETENKGLITSENMFKIFHEIVTNTQKKLLKTV